MDSTSESDATIQDILGGLENYKARLVTIPGELQQLSVEEGPINAERRQLLAKEHIICTRFQNLLTKKANNHACVIDISA